MSSGWIGGLAAAVLVPLVQRLIARLVPPTQVAGQAPLTDEERQKYASQYGLWLTLTLVGAAPSAVLLYFVFRLLSGALAPGGDAHFEMVTMPVYWILVAIFAGLLCSNLVCEMAARRQLGSDYGKFVQYQNEKLKFDSAKVNAWAYAVFSVIVAFATWRGASAFVHVHEDRLVVASLLALSPEELPFAELRVIKTSAIFIAPNGKPVRRRDFEYEFTGGREWTTRWSPAELSEPEKWEIARFISEKSGVTITELPKLE